MECLLIAVGSLSIFCEFFEEDLLVSFAEMQFRTHLDELCFKLLYLPLLTHRVSFSLLQQKLQRGLLLLVLVNYRIERRQICHFLKAYTRDLTRVLLLELLISLLELFVAFLFLAELRDLLLEREDQLVLLF